MKAEEIKKAVRNRYGEIAVKAGACCLPKAACCGREMALENISEGIGYSPEDLQAVPDGANLGLGCGNPVALASLRAGETVVDLGAGAGFDCFLAAKQVGATGHVIGVDMTPEMLDKARANARKGSYENVEFRLGEIENLPVADNSADIIISNCVINLSTDKGRVFHEAFRVLKPGGRLMVSDIVLLKELPAELQESVAAYTGCVAGALRKDDYLQQIAAAGFREVQVLAEALFPMQEIVNHPVAQKAVSDVDALKTMAFELATSIASIKVAAIKAFP
jgi:ubiquinone/menaquinone biosynthesis C-methylase UbiE